MTAVGERSSLRPDCERCFGLCCVAPSFRASADFAINKPAGQACPNLRPDSRCSIHEQLRTAGFPGCAAYDCFGSGQQVAQVTFGGRDWRQTPAVAAQMFEVFEVMRTLHQLLWYLLEAQSLPVAGPLYEELRDAYEQTERLTYDSAEALANLDLRAHEREVHILLKGASQLVRAVGQDLAGADL